MSESNNQTIASYELHVPEYIAGTPSETSGDVKAWIDSNLAKLVPNARILEIGSAFGRDADYIESQGFEVERTDATEAFVKHLQSNGKNAHLLNALTDDLGSGYDMVLANAVLLHFSRDEAKQVISKVYDSLTTGGRFAFSLKRGDGEEMSDKKLGSLRYFHYWQSDEIKIVLEETGFNQIEIDENVDSKNTVWLMISAEKDQA